MARPVFEITSPHTSVFRKGREIKISKIDATEWLNLWAHSFSAETKDTVNPELSKIFHQATLRGKAFYRFFKKVDHAIHKAEHEYAETIGLSHSGDCVTERDRFRMVAYLMGAGSAKREAICYQEITMRPRDCRKQGRKITEQRPVLVIAEAGNVRARVLSRDERLLKKLLVFGD
jgi:hypothetical protein